MNKLPEIQIGDKAEFSYGEVIYRATVYDGKITGLRTEQQIANDTSRADILKDLMSVAADTVEGKDVQITIKSNPQGPYRIIRVVTTKTKNGNRGDSLK